MSDSIDVYTAKYNELLSVLNDNTSEDKKSLSEITYGSLMIPFLLRKKSEENIELYSKLLGLAIRTGEACVREKIQRGERIKVLFFSDSAAQWAAEHLYKELAANEMIEVKVMVTPLTDRSESFSTKRYKETRYFFESKGYDVLDDNGPVDDPSVYWAEKGGYPDILIHAMPYFTSVAPAHRFTNMPFSVLHCYLPYCMYTSDSEVDRDIYGNHFMNSMWRIFCDSRRSEEQYIRYSARNGENVVCSGYAKMDFFYEKKKYDEAAIRKLWSIPEGRNVDDYKKVIIAPHWSLLNTGGPQFATFYDNYRFFIELTRKYSDSISFVFKPHPNLSMGAVESGLFKNREAYEAYLAEWNALSNARVADEESYLEIFDTSDYMILDSCSFIAEYMYTLKPMIFLTRPEQCFSALGERMLEGIYTCPGADTEKIEMLLNKLIKGDDEKKERRKEIFEEELDYMKYNGCLANDRIAQEFYELIETVSSKKISIIIPCYNASETILRTWESLKKQSIGLDALEIIFVDDASTDDGKTWRALETIEKEAPESVAIIHLEENSRQGGARNVGLQYVAGEYVLFLDADDTLKAETCFELYNIAKEKAADIVQFKHYHIADDEGIRGIPENKELKGSLEIFDLSDNNNELRKKLLSRQLSNCSCTNKLYSVELIDKAGARYAEKAIYEEPEFVYPMFLYAERMVMVDKAYYEYHWHKDSTMTGLLGKRLMDHPKVQLELMTILLESKEIYDEYKEEIDYYFFLSFYVETLLFARAYKRDISMEEMENLQEIIKKITPSINHNEYIIENKNFEWIVQTVFVECTSEEQIAEIEKGITERIF